MRISNDFSDAENIAKIRQNFAVSSKRLSSLRFRHIAVDMTSGDDDLRARARRIRSTRQPKTKSLLAQAIKAPQRAGGFPRRGGRSCSISLIEPYSWPWIKFEGLPAFGQAAPIGQARALLARPLRALGLD
jgi:hypothetical protein